MEANYPEIYKAVRVFEGGNDDDPRDPGGRTSRGIIQREWDRYRAEPGHQDRPADVWKASEEDIAIIYKRDYFDSQQLGEAPSGIDECNFDYGVNSGIGRSRKVVRRCLHMADNAPYAELKKRLDALSRDQVKTLVNAVCDERMAFLRGLRTFATFGRGWTSRVAKCRAISLHLVDFPVALVQPKEADASGSARAQVPEPTVAKNITKGGGAATGTAVAGTWYEWFASHPLETLLMAAAGGAIGAVILSIITKNHLKKQTAPPPGWQPPPELKPQGD